MVGQVLVSPRTEAVGPGIGPDVRAVSAVLAQFDIINVRSPTRLVNEDEFMGRAVERSHAAVRLRPDAKVFEFRVGGPSGPEHLAHVPPVHAMEVDGAVPSHLGEMGENVKEEPLERLRRHLA
ncbi:hypothetical protein D3C73_1264160 [compost metagenome]